MQKLSIGQRRGFMTLFIAFLVGLVILITRKKASAQTTGAPDSLLQPISRLSNSDNWLAVSKMETAGWTSGGFRVANNPWGMHQAKIRPEHQDGTYQGSSGEKIASYIDLNNAVLDLQDWVDYTEFPTYRLSLDEHIREMKSRNYFPQSANDYFALVLAWQKK